MSENLNEVPQNMRLRELVPPELLSKVGLTPTENLHTGIHVKTDGLPLVFPGVEGLPYRGRNIPTLKGNEAETKMAVVSDGKAAVFNTSKAADMTEYNRIMDCIAKGVYEISREEINWSETDKCYYIFLRWVQNQYEQKDAVYERATSVNGQLNFVS